MLVWEIIATASKQCFLEAEKRQLATLQVLI